jgi:hypothetical protein
VLALFLVEMVVFFVLLDIFVLDKVLVDEGGVGTTMTVLETVTIV